jgi:hypothetical protein
MNIYPPNEGVSGTISDVMPDIEEHARNSNGIVLELGVQYGDGSTVAIQRGLEHHPDPLHISVDIDDRMTWKPNVPWWHHVIGDDLRYATLRKVIDIGPLRYPGLIFIDTIHSYEHMQAELNLWSTLATQETVWLFHDTWSCKGMTAAIESFAQLHGWKYEDYRKDTGVYQCGLGRMWR